MFVPVRLIAASLAISVAASGMAADPTAWVKHEVFAGEQCLTAVAGDFTGDGRPDVLCNSAGKARLLVAPDWKPVILHDDPEHDCIHSEAMDVDGDGDLDYIAARYMPGLIFWLENSGTTGNWAWHLVDDRVQGIHGVLVGDVNLDGRADLIANSAQPLGDHPESLVWYDVAAGDAKQPWKRIVLAKGDAPGLSHYIGLGDMNGDGRPDVLTGAKGGPTAPAGSGDWFGWWEAPADAHADGWKKHLLSTLEPGATNLFPADVDGDGVMDVIASRGHGFGLCWFKGPDWKRTDFASDLEGPHCLAIGDIDADGDVDAATCAKDSRVTAWFANDGKGNFKVHRLDNQQAAYDIRLFDMDGDNDLDLLVAGQASNNVVWYQNRMGQ